MNFKSTEKVLEKITNLVDADKTAARNRALYIDLFNGAPPYTKEECDTNKIQVNVNFKEGQMLLLSARQQFENAFLSTANFFTIKVPYAPLTKKDAISQRLTREVNRILKRHRPYLHTMREKLGSIVLHGVGPQLWCDPWTPIPAYIAFEDLLIPRDTPITMEDLPYFAIRRRMTAGTLYRKTIACGENVDKGWNMELVRKILKAVYGLNDDVRGIDEMDQPDRMAEDFKQNNYYYEGDQAPKINLWDFYYLSEDKPGRCWYKCIVMDDGTKIANLQDVDFKEFLYKKEEPYAHALDQILHVQFGDGNNKPPFMYHSVRSLGALLFDVVHLMNRLRCQFTQKVFEDMMLLFRSRDPVDRSRFQNIYLGINQGIVPDGLEFVKNEERYKIDGNMVQTLMANYKQLMGESTSSYTRDINDNTNKERTAFEVNALLSQTAQLTGSMLNLAYLQERFAYEEECRRLTLKNTPDFVAKRFQEACREAGIPEKWIDSKRWDIEPERVLGAGNIQLQQAQSRELLALSPSLSPEAQQKIKHKHIFSTTQDPDLANDLAPLDAAPHVSDSVHDSELAFGTLMGGNPVTPKPGLNAIEVCETILNLMQFKIQNIQQSGGMGTPEDVNGLNMAAQYVTAFIQQVGMDPAQQQRAKQYGDTLGQVMNEVKGFQQRQQQAAEAMAKQQEQGQNQAEMQKMQMEAASTQQQLQTNAASARQEAAIREREMALQEAEFAMEQRRKDAEMVAKMQREQMQAEAKARQQEKVAAQAE